MVRLRSVVNFRDVGGGRTADGRRVREGVVYRSGHLASISSDDLATLESVGVRSVIDFRTRKDASEDGGSCLPSGATHLALPMGDPARAPTDLRALLLRGDGASLERHLGGGRAETIMIQAAEALVLEHRPQYGAMLRRLANPAALPAVIHCSAGKDRTGWASTLLLLIAGASDDAIVAHYEESDVHRKVENEQALARVPAGVDPEWIRPFLECRPRYARASLATLRAHYRDVDRYVTQGLAVPANELEALRSHLVA